MERNSGKKLEFNTDSQILYEIFLFYRNANIDVANPAPVNDESLVSRVNSFIEQKTLEIQNKGQDYINLIIKEFERKSFIDSGAYTRTNISNQDYFNCVMGCNHIKESIHENLSPERKEYNRRMEGCGKFKRNVSPPIDAYKYIPFNKMDIKQSKISYGLLFE